MRRHLEMMRALFAELALPVPFWVGIAQDRLDPPNAWPAPAGSRAPSVSRTGSSGRQCPRKRPAALNLPLWGLQPDSADVVRQRALQAIRADFQRRGAPEAACLAELSEEW